VTLHGETRVWTSLIWVGGCAGATGAGLQSSVGKALSGAGSEVWSAAQVEAAAWNVTWLPTLKQTSSQQRSLDRAGVAMPEMRSNLEGVSRPASLTMRPAIPATPKA
jgi:hypothetical protein